MAYKDVSLLNQSRIFKAPREVESEANKYRGQAVFGKEKGGQTYFEFLKSQGKRKFQFDSGTSANQQNKNIT